MDRDKVEEHEVQVGVSCVPGWSVQDEHPRGQAIRSLAVGYFKGSSPRQLSLASLKNPSVQMEHDGDDEFVFVVYPAAHSYLPSEPQVPCKQLHAIKIA